MVTNFTLNDTNATNSALLRKSNSQYDDLTPLVYGAPSETSESEYFARIQNGRIEYDHQIFPSLDISLLPFEPSEECFQKLEFSWEVIDYIMDELLL